MTASLDLKERIHAAMPQVRADLEKLVSIPSVSAAEHDPEPLRRSADAVAAMLRAVGAEVKILRSEAGHPAVVGYVNAPPGAPTVLLYAHHDVQPPGPDSEWKTPPFEQAVLATQEFVGHERRYEIDRRQLLGLGVA